jgi:hypothetical protein
VGQATAPTTVPHDDRQHGQLPGIFDASARAMQEIAGKASMAHVSRPLVEEFYDLWVVSMTTRTIRVCHRWRRSSRPSPFCSTHPPRLARIDGLLPRRYGASDANYEGRSERRARAESGRQSPL